MLSCLLCGREFLPIRENQKYCSQKCYNVYYSGLHPGFSTEYRRRKREILVKKCRECEVEFQTTNFNKVFCSNICKIKWNNGARETTQHEMRECPVCHKTFRPMQKTGVGRTYCTPVCRNKFYNSRRTVVSKQEYWERTKKSKWCGNWYKALQRDKFSCQTCGKKRLSSDPTTDRRYILEVHHRDGSGEMRGKNHALDNLLTLCAECHREYHTKINLVFIGGEYFVRGKIFGLLGLQSVKATI